MGFSLYKLVPQYHGTVDSVTCCPWVAMPISSVRGRIIDHDRPRRFGGVAALGNLGQRFACDQLAGRRPGRWRCGWRRVRALQQRACPAVEEHDAASRNPLISQLINQTGASSYFEWGTGGSTDSFPRALPRGGRAVAVENFPAWCSRVRAAPFASCAIAAGALEYRCLAPENETVGGAGYPAAWLRNHSDAASTRAFGSYIDAIGKDAPPGGWDAVLVDGRFRVACLLEALKFTTPNATIFLHDASRFVALDSARLEAKYAQLRAPADHEELVRLHRTHFTIEKYYEVAARAGNLVQLRRRSGAPGAADAADVTTYRRDPHRRRA